MREDELPPPAVVGKAHTCEQRRREYEVGPVTEAMMMEAVTVEATVMEAMVPMEPLGEAGLRAEMTQPTGSRMSPDPDSATAQCRAATAESRAAAAQGRATAVEATTSVKSRPTTTTAAPLGLSCRCQYRRADKGRGGESDHHFAKHGLLLRHIASAAVVVRCRPLDKHHQ
jgi:hypothetical protein